MSHITSMSARQLARAIHERTISPVEVVEAHIARIEATHAALNAVIIPTFDTARQQAQQAADAIARGEVWGPLHGVPFTAKDSLDAAGVRTTCGLVSRADNIPEKDAAVVARMRAAGAILLGKTSTPDNCGDYDTTNLLFGPTNNPWDVTRSVGGSTGGEAAIIAAGGSPLGLGSDIAGSIRLPCHCNGIVGLRPTSSALPEEGQWPPSVARLADLNALGPLARRVEDVALAWDVLRGSQPQRLDLGALDGQRVAAWFDDGILPSSGAVRSAVKAAVNAVRQFGMEQVAGAPFSRSLASVGWSAYLQAPDRKAWAVGFGNGSAWSPLAELVRALRGEPRVASGSLLGWLLLHYGSMLTHLMHIDGTRWREQLRSQMYELIGEHGVAICPIFPMSAPRHGWTLRWLAMLTTSSYTTWVNLAGLPALAVPVGCSTRRGLPVGVQVVGMPGTEHAVLAAGLAIQQVCMPQWNGPDI